MPLVTFVPNTVLTAADLNNSFAAKADSAFGLTTMTASAYTLVAGDATTELILCNSATAQTVTVPPNASVAFGVGTTITVAQLGAGAVTLAQGAGVTINSVSSNKKLSAQYAAASLIKTDTNTWLLIGSLIA